MGLLNSVIKVSTLEQLANIDMTATLHVTKALTQDDMEIITECRDQNFFWLKQWI